MRLLERTQLIPRSIDEVWPFFCDPRNLDPMTPRSLEFEIVSGADQPMRTGQIIEYRIRIAPGVRHRWITEISHCDPYRCFIDEQRYGPYRVWHHTHRFETIGNGVLMTDLVQYQMPFEPLGSLIHALFVKRRLKSIFDYRRAYIEKRFDMGAESNDSISLPASA